MHESSLCSDATKAADEQAEKNIHSWILLIRNDVFFYTAEECVCEEERAERKKELQSVQKERWINKQIYKQPKNIVGLWVRFEHTQWFIICKYLYATRPYSLHINYIYITHTRLPLPIFAGAVAAKRKKETKILFLFYLGWRAPHIVIHIYIFYM